MAIQKLAVLLVVGMLAVAAAQPFTFERPMFEPDLAEPTQRAENNYTGFTFNFDTEPVRPWLLQSSSGKGTHYVANRITDCVVGLCSSMM